MLKCVYDRRALIKGILLLVSFFILFALILEPIIPGPRYSKVNLLEYADETFNQLSKGSSWFIPDLRKKLAALKGGEVHVMLKGITLPALAPVMETLVQQAGGDVVYEDGVLEYSGPLAGILAAAVDDSSMLYDNDGEKLSDKYGGLPWQDIARAWWELLSPSVRALQMQGRVADAKLVNEVVLKAVEPGNNFYGIKAAGMSGHVLLVCALLAFYLVYTLWYGFGIMDIFQGLGLLAKGHEQHAD